MGVFERDCDELDDMDDDGDRKRLDEVRERKLMKKMMPMGTNS